MKTIIAGATQDRKGGMVPVFREVTDEEFIVYIRQVLGGGQFLQTRPIQKKQDA